MQKDFHYYATYCAAYLAGYSHAECMEICTAAQFTDLCSATFLQKIRAPRSAATTQSTAEMGDARTDILGLQNITRIWASFHFLPHDLYAKKEKRTRSYMFKYRLLCHPNGSLVKDTVELAKGRGTEAAGLAMHVLADTWAHSNFAGTPSLIMNNTNFYFSEVLPDGSKKEIHFRPNPMAPDDLEKGLYTATMFQSDEHSVMNLGHGRAGHLPDYSFMRFRYMPAWGDYEEILKDNPSDYFHAFCQMIEAMKYLRGERDSFALECYDFAAVEGLEEEIRAILCKRQADACADWKAFGEKLSGQEIPDFSIGEQEAAYVHASGKEQDDTFLGRFILAALRHKSMVTNQIFRSGNLLAGYSVDFDAKGFKGIRDFRKLVEEMQEDGR